MSRGKQRKRDQWGSSRWRMRWWWQDKRKNNNDKMKSREIYRTSVGEVTLHENIVKDSRIEQECNTGVGGRTSHGGKEQRANKFVDRHTWHVNTNLWRWSSAKMSGRSLSRAFAFWMAWKVFPTWRFVRLIVCTKSNGFLSLSSCWNATIDGIISKDVMIKDMKIKDTIEKGGTEGSGWRRRENHMLLKGGLVR